MLARASFSAHATGPEELRGMRTFTAIVERDEDQFVASCPELDIASQGSTRDVALSNLKEAVELFLETASPDEIARRLRSEVIVTHFDAAHG